MSIINCSCSSNCAESTTFLISIGNPSLTYHKKPLNNLTKGVACIFGGFLIQLSLGTIYTFGNMSPYIASYLKYKTNDTWVTNGHMVWIFSLTVFFQGNIMPFGGLLEKRIGARITCLIGCWAMSLGTIFTYFTLKVNIWSVIVTYAVIFGAGNGIAYAVSIATALKWFPKRKGFVSGLVSAGYGLGSLVFSPIQTRVINPLNLSPNASLTVDKYFSDDTVLNNVPLCFVIIGCSYAVIQLIAVIILTDSAYRNPKLLKISMKKETDKSDEDIDIPLPEQEKISIEMVQINEEEKSQTGTLQEIETKPAISQDYTIKQTLKSSKFWILCATIFCNGIFIVTISSLYKSFGQTFISNDRYFSIVAAIASIFNSAGRPMWGKLLDIFPYRMVMSALTVSTSLFMGSYFFISYIILDKVVQVVYFIWVCFLFLCIAGNFGIFPTIISKSFGNTNMATIYGMIYISYAISGIMGALICSMLLQKIGYGGVFIISTVSSLTSLSITQFFHQ